MSVWGGLSFSTVPINPSSNSLTNSAKRAKFSPSNVAEYEKLYMKEHNQAIGCITRDVLNSPTVKTAKTALELFMEEHPVPAHIHEPFSNWIERNRRAKFDCFSPPNWNCVCCSKHHKLS